MKTIIVNSEQVYTELSDNKHPKHDCMVLTIWKNNINFGIYKDEMIYYGKIEDDYISFDKFHHKKSWYVSDFDELLYVNKLFKTGEYYNHKDECDKMLIALFKNTISLIEKLNTKSISLCAY